MKKSTTKRALLSSVLALVMCFGMLTGTTFAWFTDTVTSGTNIIAAGNLDVELYHNTNEVVDSNTKLFDDVDSDLWEPGAMAYEVLTVENKGSLALKYQLTLNALNATVIDGVSFASKLKVAVVEDPTYTYDRATIVADTSLVWTDLATFTRDGELVNKGDKAVYGIIIWWQPSDNDNLFNMNNENQGNTVSVDVGVNLFATQLSSESDAFGNDYDADAPIVSAPVVLPETGNVVLAGDKDVKVALPSDLVEALAGEKVSLSVSEPVVDTTANTITFDSIEVVNEDGEIIDLAELATGAKITITLPAQNVFAPNATVMIYHDGEYMGTATVNADTTISYQVEHLCEVSIGEIKTPVVDADNENLIKISNVAELMGFANSVNAGNSYNGKTVVLTADIDLNGVAWTPIGIASNKCFSGTFDGQGHTISNLVMTPSSGTYGAGFFGNLVGGATVKNVTFDNASCDLRANVVAVVAGYVYGSATFENITVKNSSVLGFGKVATIVGLVADPGAHTVTLNNCKVENTTVGGTYNIGGLMGLVLQGVTVNATDCTTDVKLILKDTSYNKSYVQDADGNWMWAYSASYNYAGAAEQYCYYDAQENEFCMGVAKNIKVMMANETMLREAIAKGGTIVLDDNIMVDADTAITIPAGVEVVLDLNGYTLSGVSNKTGANKSLIIVNKGGKLTVKNGTVTMEHEGDNMGWNNSTNALEAVSGGELTIENVHVKNLGGSDMAYAINVGNNGGATFTAIASTIESVNYTAFRVFNNADGAIKVNFTNGTKLTGASAPFFVHFWSEKDLGAKQATRQAYLTVNFNDTEVSRYSGSKSLVRFGFDDAIYYADTAMTTVAVANGEALKAALAAGKNVVFANDITMAATAGGYDKVGIIVDKGQIVDGNGHTLTVTGAGATWSCAIYLSNGTIKNITVAGAMRGVFTAGQSADLYLDNVTFKNVVYTFNSDAGNKDYTIYINNCNMNGWTSHSDVHKEVVYTNCNFGEGSGYAFCRPYGSTQFVNCTFAAGYEIDARGAVTFEGCTFNGEAVTADNVATLVTSNTANATVVK